VSVGDRPRVVLATANPGKLREIRAILAGHALDVVPQSDLGITAAEENGSTFVANALIKARHAARLSGLPAIADDSGLEVDALQGEPGVRSARYAGPGSSDAANIALLLSELTSVPEDRRTGRYRCAMVFVRDAHDAAPIVREAVWEGRIGRVPRGGNGFGYDPVFLPAEGTCTVAELDSDAKNRSSHRARALQALAQAMRDAGW